MEILFFLSPASLLIESRAALIFNHFFTTTTNPLSSFLPAWSSTAYQPDRSHLRSRRSHLRSHFHFPVGKCNRLYFERHIMYVCRYRHWPKLKTEQVVCSSCTMWVYPQLLSMAIEVYGKWLIEGKGFYSSWTMHDAQSISPSSTQVN
jgi:hypothetical protein